jgi:oxygen-independent coproporphyrinogen-3 oxidase
MGIATTSVWAWAPSARSTRCARNTRDARQYREQLASGQLATHSGWFRQTADPVRLHVAERLACDLELDIPAVERRYGLVFRRYFAACGRCWKPCTATV